MALYEDPVSHEDWTPAQGVVRGLVSGTVAAVILAAIADLLAWFAPPMVLEFWMRAPEALFTVWILFVVVHRAAGMASWHCTAIVIVLTLFIILSQHVVFSIHGVLTYAPKKWEWFSPQALVVYNLSAVVGAGFGVWAWKDGASVDSLLDMFGRGGA
jgi:hypothetical protein